MTNKAIQRAFFLGLVLLTTVGFLWLINDYLEPVFWAAVMAILFYPVQRRWLGVTGNRPSAAAGLSILTVVLIVLIPLFFVGLAVTNESINFYERLSQGDLRDTPAAVLERLRPALERLEQVSDRFRIDEQEITTRVSQGVVQLSQGLAGRAVAIGQNAVRFTIALFVMLYVLFFFLRGGPAIIDKLIRVLPLGDIRERRLFAKFEEVSRATIKGTLVIGIVQGALGGILFLIAGVTAPVFWAVIMTILSIIPAVGAGLIWAPAGIILLLTGKMWQGVLVLTAGALIIGLVDNLLRPKLVGKDTQMPDALVLLSTLGGLAVFGISGFVIGPIIAAFFLVVWDMFEEEFNRE